MVIFDSASILDFRRRLLRHYRRHRRDLPWRRTRDPYAIWVSEIMLQQTQVATVEPYYQRFLSLFPTVRALAAARLDDVLKAWEGLGYYSRARNLHKAAAYVAETLGGQLPREAADLQTLAGIGRYTAGAIASIAFNQPAPILDGNVIRVLCRLGAIGANPKTAATNDMLWSWAARLVPARSPGDFNQAMMELGATLCTPVNPLCSRCPVVACCKAYATGRQHELPRKATAKPLPHHHAAVAVILRRGTVLIDQRRHKGLLGGLWEFPGGKIQRNETAEQALAREVREEVGIAVQADQPLATVKHTYSHFRVTLHAYLCRHLAGRAKALGCDNIKWVKLGDLRRYAYPRATLKIIEALMSRLGR